MDSQNSALSANNGAPKGSFPVAHRLLRGYAPATVLVLVVVLVAILVPSRVPKASGQQNVHVAALWHTLSVNGAVGEMVSFENDDFSEDVRKHASCQQTGHAAADDDCPSVIHREPSRAIRVEGRLKQPLRRLWQAPKSIQALYKPSRVQLPRPVYDRTVGRRTRNRTSGTSALVAEVTGWAFTADSWPANGCATLGAHHKTLSG